MTDGMPKLTRHIVTSARHQGLIGRRSECRKFRRWLAAQEADKRVIHIQGPAGQGKTTLLKVFQDIAAEEGIAAVRVDFRDVEANPTDVMSFICNAVGAPSVKPVLPVIRRVLSGKEFLLLFDTVESSGGLTSWLFEKLLASLPDTVSTVMAGRTPLPEEIRLDPGWSQLIASWILPEFTESECRRFLSSRQVSAEHHHTIIKAARGNPLALALVAEAFAENPQVEFSGLESLPGVVTRMLRLYVREMPSRWHLKVLRLCALQRHTSGDSLRAVLRIAEPQPYFEWLSGLSFVHFGRNGLYLHEMVRDVILSEFRYSDEHEYREVLGRLVAWIAGKLRGSADAEYEKLFNDLVYIGRHSAKLENILPGKIEGGERDFFIDRYAKRHLRAVKGLVRLHEGERQAKLAEYWLRRQPEGAWLVHGPKGDIQGYVHLLQLSATGEDDRRRDTLVDSICRTLYEEYSLSDTDKILLGRFLIDRDCYQALSPSRLQLTLAQSREEFARGRLDFSCHVVAEPDSWHDFMELIGYYRLAGCEQVAGNRRFGVFGHDWRKEPAWQWMWNCAVKLLDLGDGRKVPSEFLVDVLSRAEYARAARRLLKNLHKVEAIQGSRLLASALVQKEMAGGNSPVVVLKKIVVETVAEIEQQEGGQRHGKILTATFLGNLPKQEAVAFELGIPYGTYRHHLRQAVDELVERLWQKELSARAQLLA